MSRIYDQHIVNANCYLDPLLSNCARCHHPNKYQIIQIIALELCTMPPPKQIPNHPRSLLSNCARCHHPNKYQITPDHCFRTVHDATTQTNTKSSQIIALELCTMPPPKQIPNHPRSLLSNGARCRHPNKYQITPDHCSRTVHDATTQTNTKSPQIIALELCTMPPPKQIPNHPRSLLSNCARCHHPNKYQITPDHCSRTVHDATTQTNTKSPQIIALELCTMPPSKQIPNHPRSLLSNCAQCHHPKQIPNHPRSLPSNCARCRHPNKYQITPDHCSRTVHDAATQTNTKSSQIRSTSTSSFHTHCHLTDRLHREHISGSDKSGPQGSCYVTLLIRGICFY